ncbi:MAG: hypothetical protein ACT4OO_09490 [Nitrospiraceae bacterium]
MANLLEYVGCVHIFLGPYRGNPIALYLKRGANSCSISAKAYPWNDVMGVGETPNKAAADFEEKWKSKRLSPDMYNGPAWEGGVKPERPAPPKPPAAPKPAASSPGSAGVAPSPPATPSSLPPAPSAAGSNPAASSTKPS